ARAVRAGRCSDANGPAFAILLCKATASQGKVTHGKLFPRSQTFAKLQERSLYQEEKESSSEVNAKFDAEKSGDGRRRDVVAPAKLRDEVHDDFLNEVCAVGDAGDERRARNRNSTKR